MYGTGMPASPTFASGSQCPWPNALPPMSPAVAVLQLLARRSLPPPLALPVLHLDQLRST